MAVWLGANLLAQGQDAAFLEERIKRLTGYIQDLQEESQSQKRQIDALVRELAALREQNQNRPAATPASQDDLRELARKVQEMEEKRKADRAFLEKEFDRLTQIATAKPAVSRPPERPANTPAANLPKDAFEHTIASGDTLLAIALAYSKETGKKITVDMIQRANEGLKPERMQVGQKILIPVPDK
ncbi:MAG TPA: LysM peptidoglycan-binding domain-containing protein [Verrucomicrobiota bacterium]|nr:LysM peptidoglycan-binding domain-containing protein [Verrucomicrobiota bacterium]HNT13429.1 LysM peptidoglycan-binding domain-containing protein [Verrucomicrobiota bacterium]